MAKTMVVDMGDLKPVVKRAARAAGVTMNEFIVNAIDSRVRRDREYQHNDNYVRHGGKHLDGKHTGYEATKDGKYFPAPLWTKRFNDLFAERAAIWSLVNYIVQQSEERLAQVEKRIAESKDELIDDLGLDRHKDWAYYGGSDGYLVEQPRPSETTEREGTRDADS